MVSSNPHKLSLTADANLSLDTDATTANLRHPDRHSFWLQEGGLHQVAAVALHEIAAPLRQVHDAHAQQCVILGVAAQHDARAPRPGLLSQRVKAAPQVVDAASNDSMQADV